MESKAKALGHPIHQMLVPFPFGLLATAVIFDIIYLVWGNPAMAAVAFWMIAAGIVEDAVVADGLPLEVTQQRERRPDVLPEAADTLRAGPLNFATS